ncbi:MAG: M81 family metallopeptidase [Rhodovibrionaceae bacterium]|nr:M81 family metallopeptidase [Rhodovibrionaceae bacterium]
MRIAVGGFQHETNTFAPSPARLADFERAGGWPGLTCGEGLFEAVAGINIPIAGFVEAAGHRYGHELVPLCWAQATPSAQVTEEAFEKITGLLLDGLAGAGSLDAVYLDLHGAMVAEHQPDGEGEILRRVRDRVGHDIPVVVSLDLHANVSPEMFELATALVSFRTYPHVDMAETGARAARHLDFLLRGGRAAARAFRQVPFLMPLTAGCTMVQPAKGLYDLVAKLEDDDVASVSFNAGFAPADTYHCGPSALAYGANQARADAAADLLLDYCLEHEAEFAGTILPARDAVAYAIDRARTSNRPVVLADTQDNPGAGGNGDTVGLLEELVRQEAEEATFALLCDGEAAAAAHAAGEGARTRIALGGRSGLPGMEPFEAEVLVERLGDGRFTATGPFYEGSRMQLGPMACLKIGGVRVAVCSGKIQAADREMLRHVGIEPTRQKILALKSSVHFRADFEPIAEEVLVAASPGPNPADHLLLDYRELRPGVRLMPAGPVFAPETVS